MDPIGTSSQPSNPVSGGLPQGGGHAEAQRPKNLALAGDTIGESGRNIVRGGSNLVASGGYSGATLLAKAGSALDKHSTTLDPNTQPKRYAAATKTVASCNYLAKQLEAGARKLTKLAELKQPPLPKR